MLVMFFRRREMRTVRQSTSVAIIGAGPAGLMLGHLLAQADVPFVILEAQTLSLIHI